MWVFLRVFLSTFLGLCWSPHLGPEAKPTESHCCIMNFSITSQRWDCVHTASTICDLASGKDRAAGQYAQLKPVKQFSEIIKKTKRRHCPVCCFEGFSDGWCCSIGFSAVFSAQQKPQKSAGATSAAVGGGWCRHSERWGSDAGANRENFSMRMKEWKKVFFHF